MTNTFSNLFCCFVLRGCVCGGEGACFTSFVLMFLPVKLIQCWSCDGQNFAYYSQTIEISRLSALSKVKQHPESLPKHQATSPFRPTRNPAVNGFLPLKGP